MNYIKDKKAWKAEVVKAGDLYRYDNMPPQSYPCYLSSYLDDNGLISFRFYCQDELQSMLAKLDSGREF